MLPVAVMIDHLRVNLVPKLSYNNIGPKLAKFFSVKLRFFSYPSV